MSPLDQISDTASEILVEPNAAIVLPGGRVALVIERADVAVPQMGTVDGAGGWQACVRDNGANFAVCALLPGMPQHGARLRDADGRIIARLGRPGYLDVAAAPLLRLVRDCDVDSAALFGFLHRHLASVSPTLVADFLAGAAGRDGFVELAARTECGGLYLQGWAQTLEAGPVKVIGFDDADRREIEVARFGRDDILPPGSGICLYAKLVDAERAVPEALYFESGGSLRRLDVVPSMAAPITEGAATGHIRAMLARLDAPRTTMGAFRRICRPRYEGGDTLSGYAGPIAAALDRVLRAADGTILVSGWLLDPLARVEHMILKSQANLYAPLHKTWNLLPRPDLNSGFGQDPRFAGLLDDREVMHGFICHAAATPDKTDDGVYLELVLDDGTCLFRPVDVTPCHGDGALPAILGGLSPDEPELPQIVEGHLAPFLAGLARRTTLPLRRSLRPVPLGGGKAGRKVAAVMPVTIPAELQPVLAGLADSADAELLDLTLVAGRSLATPLMRDLEHAFDFYGLAGDILVVPDHLSLAARLDAGIATGDAPHVLIWQPSALPKSRGWLPRLAAEARRLSAGLISPALTYEDGSTYYHGTRRELSAGSAICARAGFSAPAKAGDGADAVSSGAAEAALIDRRCLDAAGGISGGLFGDAYTHLDLAARLTAAGAGIWCDRTVEFWMLEDLRPEDDAPFARMTRAVDAALIARRNQEATP